MCRCTPNKRQPFCGKLIAWQHSPSEMKTEAVFCTEDGKPPKPVFAKPVESLEQRVAKLEGLVNDLIRWKNDQ